VNSLRKDAGYVYKNWSRTMNHLSTKRLFVTVMAAMASIGTSTAGTTAATTVEKILLSDSGMLVFVYPTGGAQGGPSCGSTFYSFSAARPMAKEYFAALLAAQARGALVTFWGKGTCQDHASSETLDYFRIEN
jgi:hypothetical protein